MEWLTFLAILFVASMISAALVMILDLSAERALLIGLATVSVLSTTRLFLQTRLQRVSRVVFIPPVGFRRSGKTVYLTVLYDQLRAYAEGPIDFLPYGAETMAEVAKNMSYLESGRWLPATSAESMFNFRALVTFRSPFGRRRWQLVMPDFPGEESEDFATESATPSWLPKDEFFRELVDSDGVMLAVDSEAAFKGTAEQVVRIESKLIATVNALVAQKAAPFQGGMRSPLALVFLKTDVLNFEINPKLERMELERSFQKLIAVCTRHCRSFMIFHVSSVGQVDERGNPIPRQITPRDVEEPFLWLLERIARVNLRPFPRQRESSSEELRLTSRHPDDAQAPGAR